MGQPRYIGAYLNQQALPIEKRHPLKVRYQTALPTREVTVAWEPLLGKYPLRAGAPSRLRAGAQSQGWGSEGRLQIPANP
jgi:hypothetical protein